MTEKEWHAKYYPSPPVIIQFPTLQEIIEACQRSLWKWQGIEAYGTQFLNPSMSNCHLCALFAKEIDLNRCTVDSTDCARCPAKCQLAWRQWTQSSNAKPMVELLQGVLDSLHEKEKDEKEKTKKNSHRFYVAVSLDQTAAAILDARVTLPQNITSADWNVPTRFHDDTPGVVRVWRGKVCEQPVTCPTCHKDTLSATIIKSLAPTEIDRIRRICADLNA